MKWTDAEGNQHHDMGTCYCGEHHAFDGLRQLRERIEQLETALRGLVREDSGCYCQRDELANSGHDLGCIAARAALDGGTAT